MVLLVATRTVTGVQGTDGIQSDGVTGQYVLLPE